MCQPCWRKVNDFHQFYQSVLVLYESRGWPPDAGECTVDDKLSVVLLTNDATTTTPSPPSLADDDVLLNYSDDDTNVDVAGDASQAEDDSEDEHRTRTGRKASHDNIPSDDPPPPTKRKRGRPRKSEQRDSNQLVKIESMRDEPASITSVPNQCSDCNKTYTSAKRLESHRRLKHAAVDSEAAAVGPEKLPNTNENRPGRQRNDEELLHRYMRMACNECGVPFATFADAKRHHEQAHDRYGYVECCDRKFSTKGRAVQHCLWHENPHQFE